MLIYSRLLTYEMVISHLSYTEFLIELFEQRYVHLKILIVVPHIYKCPEELMREYQLECLSVFLNGVEEAKQSKAEDLHLVLSLGIFPWVLTL
jgi:hypothetical protein